METEPKKKTMRNYWFEFVATTRKKLARKLKKDVTHKVAMKEASKLWPKEKLKIMNRIRRAERKAARAASSGTD